jgi:hypothetical protein
MIVVVSIQTALPPKGMGAQVTCISQDNLASNVRMTKSTKGLISPRSSARRLESLLQAVKQAQEMTHK